MARSDIARHPDPFAPVDRSRPPDYALRSSLDERVSLPWPLDPRPAGEHDHLPLVACPTCNRPARQEPGMTITRGTELLGNIPGPIRCKTCKPAHREEQHEEDLT